MFSSRREIVGSIDRRRALLPARQEADVSEQEYRKVVAAVLAKVEAEARRLGRKVLIPTALGAGLVLGAGCGDSGAPPTPDSYIPTDAHPYGVDSGPWPRDVASPKLDVYIPSDAHPYGVDSGPWPDLQRDAASDGGVDAARDASTSDATSDATQLD